MLSFLEDIEPFGSEDVGLVVCDGVVGGGGDDDVVGEVDVEEACGFVEFLGVFDVAKRWFY